MNHILVYLCRKFYDFFQNVPWDTTCLLYNHRITSEYIGTCMYLIIIIYMQVTKFYYVHLISFMSSCFRYVGFSPRATLLVLFFLLNLFSELPRQKCTDGKEWGQTHQDIIHELPRMLACIQNNPFQPTVPIYVKPKHLITQYIKMFGNWNQQ